MTPEIGRAKRAPAGDDEAVEHERGKELAVEDELVRANASVPNFAKAAIREKKRDAASIPEASHGTNRRSKNSECAPDGGDSSRQMRETKAEHKRKTGRSSAPTRRSGRVVDSNLRMADSESAALTGLGYTPITGAVDEI